MKSIIASAILLASIQAHAFSMPTLQFPTESGWATAMVSMACDIPMSELKGSEGKIIKNNDGVVYTVSADGAVIASASARNTSVFATKTCLD